MRRAADADNAERGGELGAVTWTRARARRFALAAPRRRSVLDVHSYTRAEDEDCDGIPTDDDCDCYQLQTQETLATVGENIKSIVSEVNPRGATLFRGLDQIIEDNSSFGKLVDMIGDKFSYTAGMATRREFDDAPG